MTTMLAAALFCLPILGPQISAALAQGTALTNQDRLAGNGPPANGTYDLEFSIQDAQSGEGVHRLVWGNLPDTAVSGRFVGRLDEVALARETSPTEFAVAARLIDGAIEISLRAPAWARVSIETSSDLVTWSVLAERVIPESGLIEVIDPEAGVPKRFYRAAAGLPPARLMSRDLIERAQAEGRIDGETALIYQVYAAYGDPRLPAEFHGDDELAPGSLVGLALAEEFGSLSPEAQALLAPFLLPPSAPGSWLELQGQAAQRALGLATAPPTAMTPRRKVWPRQSMGRSGGC
jgi:hypothetical protein